ncbi:ribonuclease H-like domain-containing protein [Tanacetum coccineum]
MGRREDSWKVVPAKFGKCAAVYEMKIEGTKNINGWSCAMLLALEGRNKTGFIDNTCRRSNTDEVLGRQWDRVNVVQFDALVQLPRCTCHAAEDFKKVSLLMKLMQFLMGLDDSYMQLRSNILSRDPLPDAKGAYVLISSEESHIAVVIGGAQRSQTLRNTPRPNNVPRPNNNGNKRAAGGPTLVCENYGFNGHTIDRCFKLIGYPADFGKKNNTSNNNQIVHEYCVTLVSVHKVARDSKFIVGFAESKCFLMSHDLMDVTIIRIGKQVGGLYYFDSIRGGIPLNLWTECILTACYLINSPIIDHFEDDVGHPQGSNGPASENEMAATSEHDSTLSEGDDNNILDT